MLCKTGFSSYCQLARQNPARFTGSAVPVLPVDLPDTDIHRRLLNDS